MSYFELATDPPTRRLPRPESQFRFLKHIESEAGPKPEPYEYGSEGPEGFKKFEEKLGYQAGLQ